MKIPPFELERYFAKYEFSARYLLSSSDCDGLSLNSLLGAADSTCRGEWYRLHLGYTESLGLPALREAIAALYTDITPDQVLEVVPEEGIFLTLNALLEPGDHVIATCPGYQSLTQVAESIGCEVTRWLPIEEEGWRFDPAFLKQALRPNTRLIIINFPHNPTGYLPSQADFHAILDLARQAGAYVLSDEMYRFLEFDPLRRLPAACEVYDKAVSLFGMSKTFGLAGLRVGWLVTRDADLYRQLASLKDYTTICGSAPSEFLALVGLQQKEKIIATHLARIRRNLGLAEAFFARHADAFSWVPPQAGTIAFPRLNLPISSLDFAEAVVKDSGVMLLPSTVYAYDDKHFRIGLGRQNFPEALAAFEGYLEQHIII